MAVDVSAAATRIGPMDGRVTSVAVSAAATAEAAIPYLGSGGSNAFLVFQAIGADVNIIFGIAGMAAPTVSANSLRILSGFKEEWVVPPGCTHYRTIASGAGFLLIAPASP